MLLDAMRQLALDFLCGKLEGGLPPEDPDAWLRKIRTERPQDLLKFLLEDPERIPRVYVIEPVPGDPLAARLSCQDLTERHSSRVPFSKRPGSQSGMMGPVFKRTWKGTEGGPSVKIQNTTVKDLGAALFPRGPCVAKS
jgi:CRISPR-associated protein Csh1